MNVKLLRKIQKHILAEPKRYDQDDFVREAYGKGAPPCGTVCCLAGWAHILGNKIDLTRADKRKLWDDSYKKGGVALKLTDGESQRLFTSCTGNWMGEQWPDKFQDAYRRAKTARQRARVAARRIDHFIKTKGVE